MAKDWKNYVRNYDNKKLLSVQKSVQNRPDVFRKTGLSKVIKDEIAKRKKSGEMKKSAGKKKKSQNPFGTLLLPRGLF